jgi:CHAD domain-containing protein
MAHAREVRGLSCDETYRSAAGKILWTRFEEMVSFTEVALAGEDIEGVHDMRVASRRLRAAIEIFQDAFPKRRLRPMLREVKQLADALGGVRDRDVMIARLERDKAGRPRSEQLVLAELIQEAQEERMRARQALQAKIDGLEGEDFRRRFLAFVAKETM